MKKEEFYVLATKYYSREASAEEVERLNVFLKEEKYSVLFNRIGETWKQAGRATPSSPYNIARGLAMLTAKIRNSNPSFRWEKEIKQSRIFFFHPAATRIAASFAVLTILVVGALFVVHHLKQRAGSTSWNEKKTVMGEKSIVTLLDGTRITLNAGSKLKYPVRFGEDSREVILEGEAYFEVAHNANKPFIVHSGNISTKDLGTKFDVCAFPNEATIAVSLEEGAVEVSAAASGARSREIVLSPAQQFVYNRENETSTIDSFDFQKTIGWKDNILVFDNEPLSKILLPLERYFGVKFEIAEPAFTNRTIKANFKNESLWTVVKVLEKATGLTAKTTKENNEIKEVVFYEK